MTDERPRRARPRRMTERTSVHLPAGTLDRIIAVADRQEPPQAISEYVRAKLLAALARDERRLNGLFAPVDAADQSARRPAGLPG